MTQSDRVQSRGKDACQNSPSQRTQKNKNITSAMQKERKKERNIN